MGEPQHWRLKRALAGGGALPDLGLCCINTARFLSGEEPVEVIGNTWSTPVKRVFARSRNRAGSCCAFRAASWPAAAELDHFAQCIQQDKEVHTPGEEGVQDQRVTEAIYESARARKAVKPAPPAGRTRGPDPQQEA